MAMFQQLPIVKVQGDNKNRDLPRLLPSCCRYSPNTAIIQESSSLCGLAGTTCFRLTLVQQCADLAR
jgi:hypothetical protein